MDSPEIARIAALAEQAAAEQPDLIAALATAVKGVVASDADPYLLMGALIEGVAHTLGTAIPPERQSDTARAALTLLLDRLSAEGLL